MKEGECESDWDFEGDEFGGIREAFCLFIFLCLIFWRICVEGYVISETERSR